MWGSILKLLGKGALAVGTGGSSLALPGVGAGSMIGDVGSMIGGAGKTAAANRGTALDASQRQDQINTQRGGEDRASLGDAWKRLHAASYTLGQTKGYTPATLGNGMVLPSMGTATPFTNDPMLRQGASGMEAEVMKRLMGGSQLAPLTDVRKMSKPSAWEKIMNIAGPALQMAGAYGQQQNGGNDIGGGY